MPRQVGLKGCDDRVVIPQPQFQFVTFDFDVSNGGGPFAMTKATAANFVTAAQYSLCTDTLGH